jgi:acid stress-induced BolA-like protein IbaG/YrbA
VSIEILGQGGAAEIQEAIRVSIVEAIPGATVRVEPGGPGHFAIRVESDAFAGKSRVKQQQLVYGAIAHLMSGPNAPVHAVDRLECVEG